MTTRTGYLAAAGAALVLFFGVTLIAHRYPLTLCIPLAILAGAIFGHAITQAHRARRRDQIQARLDFDTSNKPLIVTHRPLCPRCAGAGASNLAELARAISEKRPAPSSATTCPLCAGRTDEDEMERGAPMKQPTEPTTRHQLLKELTSNVCQCGRPKKPMQTFCSTCYSRLPQQMRTALYYNRFGEGYQEARAAAGRELALYLDTSGDQ